jgi:hypothetical protein
LLVDSRKQKKKVQIHTQLSMVSTTLINTEVEMSDLSFIMSEINKSFGANCQGRAQGGLYLKGLASARVLCPFPEYVPCISGSV